MPEAKEYRAGIDTFVDGVLKRRGEKFATEQKPSKTWVPVKAKPAKAETDDGDKRPVKKVVAEISEMTDVAALAELKDDSRSTVSAAAEKRIRELAGAGPEGDAGQE